MGARCAVSATAPEFAAPTCFCRDCLGDLDITAKRCGTCGSPRLARHPTLSSLTLAHIDCDAFYATVEKRDNPDLADKPVIIGGGKRGVVSVGLSCNKFLAKIASDMDKPRGFAALDQEQARAMLADRPVGFIFGVGPATQERLSQRGFRIIADLQRADEIDLMKQFAGEG